MTFYSDIRNDAIGVIDEFGIEVTRAKYKQVEDVASGDINTELVINEKITGVFKNIDTVSAAKRQGLVNEFESTDKYFITYAPIEKGDILTLGSRVFDVVAVIDVTPTDLTIVNQAVVRLR